jgi:hypothetical protein
MPSEFAQFVTVTVLIVFSVVARAFAIQCNWNWFISEPFELYTISMVHAFGLSGLLSLLNSHRVPTDIDNSYEYMLQGLFTSTFVSIVSLLFGYIAHLFM